MNQYSAINNAAARAAKNLQDIRAYEQLLLGSARQSYATNEGGTAGDLTTVGSRSLANRPKDTIQGKGSDTQTYDVRGGTGQSQFDLAAAGTDIQNVYDNRPKFLGSDIAYGSVGAQLEEERSNAEKRNTKDRNYLLSVLAPFKSSQREAIQANQEVSSGRRKRSGSSKIPRLAALLGNSKSSTLGG